MRIIELIMGKTSLNPDWQTSLKYGKKQAEFLSDKNRINRQNDRLQGDIEFLIMIMIFLLIVILFNIMKAIVSSENTPLNYSIIKAIGSIIGFLIVFTFSHFIMHVYDLYRFHKKWKKWKKNGER